MAITTGIELLSLLATHMTNLNPRHPVICRVICPTQLSFLALNKDLNLLLLSLASTSLFSPGFTFISKLSSPLVSPYRRCIILLVGQTVMILVTKSLERDTVSVQSLILLTLETQTSLCGQSILENSTNSRLFGSWIQVQSRCTMLRSGDPTGTPGHLNSFDGAITDPRRVS